MTNYPVFKYEINIGGYNITGVKYLFGTLNYNTNK